MTYDIEDVRSLIPYYLTEGQASLLEELKRFFEDGPVEYYIDRYPGEMLQGDGWRGLELIHFDSGNKRVVRGIVLSNTCDVSPDNNRIFPRKITFAPIIKLSNFENILKRGGVSDQKILSKVDSIKRQRVTNIFYLPAGGGLEEDYLARLDDLYTVSAESHEQNPERAKIFTLSQIGHYMFLFKISIHFCRFQEEILRNGAFAASV